MPRDMYTFSVFGSDDDFTTQVSSKKRPYNKIFEISSSSWNSQKIFLGMPDGDIKKKVVRSNWRCDVEEPEIRKKIIILTQGEIDNK